MPNWYNTKELPLYHPMLSIIFQHCLTSATASQHNLRHLQSKRSEAHLLNEVDGGLQVEAEVDEVPLDTLLAVLLLLQDEHVVVEELLQPLVGVVDAQLLKRVHREDLETSNVQNADEEVLPGLQGEGR